MTGAEPFIYSGIISAFKLCRYLWKYKQKHKASRETVAPLELALERAQGDIETRWNKLVEPIGKKMALGDG